jgi:hypothetical protein
MGRAARALLSETGSFMEEEEPLKELEKELLFSFCR